MATEEGRVRVVRKDQRAVPPAAQTPGMQREQAIADEHTWVGAVRTQPKVFSGWHHHADYDTYVYILSGRVRLEFGAGGHEHADAGPEDFIHVPRHVVHREGNPDENEAHAVLVRVGSGPSLVNVDGPDASGPVQPA